MKDPEYVAMATATTAVLMARNCGDCPIAEAAITLYLTGTAVFPDDGDIMFECKLGDTAAFCMYVGCELPWFHVISKERIHVPADEWKDMVKDAR